MSDINETFRSIGAAESSLLNDVGLVKKSSRGPKHVGPTLSVDEKTVAAAKNQSEINDMNAAQRSKGVDAGEYGKKWSDTFSK